MIARALACVAVVGLAVDPGPRADQQRPAFRGGTDLVVVDARVLDQDGKPIAGLTPADFDVRIDGARRPVVSLEFQSATDPRVTSRRDDVTITRQASTVLVVVDRLNMRPGSSRATLDAGAAFIERLPDSHRVGLVTMPDGNPSEPVGGSRAAVARDLRRTLGMYNPRTPPSEGELSAVQAMLHQAIGQLLAVSGRRTIVYLADRFDASIGAETLARRAALSSVTFYVVAADVPVTSAESPSPVLTRSEDDGLGALAGATGGLYLRRAAGAAGIFDRIAAELSGQYLLTFAADPEDRGTHQIRVSVNRDGASVHARREFVK